MTATLRVITTKTSTDVPNFPTWLESQPDSLLSAYPSCSGKTCAQVFSEIDAQRQRTPAGLISKNEITSENGLSTIVEYVWDSQSKISSLATLHQQFVGPGEHFKNGSDETVQDHAGNYLYFSPYGYLFYSYRKATGTTQSTEIV